MTALKYFRIYDISSDPYSKGMVIMWQSILIADNQSPPSK